MDLNSQVKTGLSSSWVHGMKEVWLAVCDDKRVLARLRLGLDSFGHQLSTDCLIVIIILLESKR
jgi:hypothetical protein